MILRSPRHGAFIFIISLTISVLVLLHRSRYLIGLLFEDGGRDAVVTPDLPGNTTPPLLIPKIIHQTYNTTKLPEHWANAQYAVKYHHPDYEYKFWTDESGLEFIKTHYPSFLPTYVSYPYPIQRADALRYFLLYHYGGIYIDLDLFPYKPLTPLLTLPAVACRTTPTGISNDILFSTPHHPFFALVINRLQSYNRNLLLPYLTIMYTTGPLFLSAIWIEYLRGSAQGGGPLERLHVLVQGPVRGDNFGFWKNINGGSWHGRDLHAIFWMRDHLILTTFLGFVIAFVLVFGLWVVVKRCAMLPRSERWMVLHRERQKLRQRERLRARGKLESWA